ncbi:MAG TPA: amidohydrolase, partial [Salinimicrobium sp.]|nr:amidohydrolase [Salinimicrobium sp.]
MLKNYLFPLLTLLLSFTAIAQEKEKENKKWNVSDPYSDDWDIKEVPLKTDEGTWMNLDVSPDGKTIVFDMLGDIYIMPISGGKAKVLRSGMAFEVQPRFSPDGSKISFTSDAGGANNIWIMNADGSDAYQLTKEDFRLLNNAVWTADGNSIIARKHFTSGRSLGAGEMWQYHLGGEAGLQLTERKNDQQDVNEPSVSPDGRYLYYSEDMYPGGMFQYNKDPNKQIYVIKRYDLKTGETEMVTGGPGGAARPQVSPDGNKLAFVKRVRTKSVMFIHDLETGEEWPVYDELSKDQQEAWAIFGVYPGFSWMPEGRDIVFWSQGKIKRVDTETFEVEEIPFLVDTKIKIAKTHSTDHPVFKEEFNPKVIRHAVTSPDGKTLVFNAVGYLWKKKLPGGEPERITEGEDFEFEPAFSPDGEEIVYVTWDDQRMGSINKVSLDGGEPEELTKKKGIYRNPGFSNNGEMIVFSKADGNYDMGMAFSKEPGIYLMSASGENIRKIYDEGQFPMFNKDDSRIFFQTGGTFFGRLTKSLRSIDLRGKDERTLVNSKYGNRLLPSPDNKWIALINLHQVYLAPLVLTGKPLNLGSETKAVPVTQVSKDAGLNIHWSADSKKIHWTLGDQYFTNEVSKRFTFLENSVDSIPPITEKGIEVGLEIEADRPEGKIAFTNARIITMNGEKVIENGTLVIKENKIAQIGTTEDIEIPGDALVYDLKGKTIMPGIIDVHAHIGAFRYGLTPKKHWPAYANLAFGVTTAHDPSALSETVFAMAELIKSGEMVGPRIFSTGIILYGAEGDFKAEIGSLEDAMSAIRRTKAFGATSVK